MNNYNYKVVLKIPAVINDSLHVFVGDSVNNY